MVSKLVMIWLLLGIVSLVGGYKSIHAPENKEKVAEHIKAISEEFDLAEYDSVALLYLGFIVFGFIAIPAVVIRKIAKKLRRTDSAK